MAHQIQLWPGSPVLLDGPGVHSPGTDSVLLSGFASGGSRIADLGCGGGVLALLMASRFPEAGFLGIDSSPAACQLAREAVELNGLGQRIRILQADLRELSALPEGGSFDCAVANPPYFSVGSGKTAAGERAGQRSEQDCTLSGLCRAAQRLVRWGGSFSLVYRPERLTDLLCALREFRFEPKRLQLVRHHPGAGVSLVLVESRHGGRPGLSILEDFLLANADGSESHLYRALYHREANA